MTVLVQAAFLAAAEAMTVPVPPPALPLWGLWIAALAPVLVAATVAYVAWQQWQTAHAKLRFDLFEKRLAVYFAARDLISLANVHGGLLKADYDEFAKRTQGFEFLFAAETRDYCKCIRDLAFEAAFANAQRQNDEKAGRIRDAIIDKEDAMLSSLRDQGLLLDQKFRTALDLSRV